MSDRDKHVVAGVDGSDESLAILDWATTYAGTIGADLTVVTAWSLSEAARHHDAEAGDDMSVTLSERLEYLVRQTCTGITHHVVLEQAPPATLLLRESQDGDVLVIGTHGRHGHRLSPVVRAVLVDACCPVVLVPLAQVRTKGPQKTPAGRTSTQPMV
ncbi:MAG: universal stress protein [Nocardioides sp.]